MSPLALAFLIVSAVLFLLAALFPLFPPQDRWHGSLVALGLFFLALSLLVPAFGAQPDVETWTPAVLFALERLAILVGGVVIGAVAGFLWGRSRGFAQGWSAAIIERHSASAREARRRRDIR